MSDGSVYIDGEKYPLPEQVIQNIETVIGMQAKQAQTVPIHVRFLRKIAAAFGTATFLYALLLFFAVWISWSYLSGEPTLPFNLPKYDLQSQMLDTAALLIATGVLVNQSHQEKLAEQRSHLMLQINLLTEQKTAKLIGLLEEMRADSPDLKDREDWEAEVMQQATDPQVVLNILQENLESTEEGEIADIMPESPETP
ncbi:MAG: DUF1003 domain-containing protein [Cyanobacteria bacterium P01_G01_bin.38]